MVEEHLMGQEILQKQREAEERVRRMREQNRRLAQQMGACPPEERKPPAPPRPRGDGGRWLPLLLALIIWREGGPWELIAALVYLAL